MIPGYALPVFAAIELAVGCYPSCQISYVETDKVFGLRYNAMTYGRTIHITSLALSTNTPDELAFMVGHEYGHLMLGPGISELTADWYGVQVMDRAGYDACASLRVMARFPARGSRTHPARRVRIETLGLACRDSGVTIKM